MKTKMGLKSMLITVSAAAGVAMGKPSSPQEGVGLSLGYRGRNLDSTFGREGDLYFGGLLKQQNSKDMGVVCLSNIVQTCPACTQPSPEALELLASIGQPLQDQCTIYCTTPNSETCQACRSSLQQECFRCRMANAAALIEAGCSQIACERALAGTCPVCSDTWALSIIGGCVDCKQTGDPAKCEACRIEQEKHQEEAEKCVSCKKRNAQSLFENGCLPLQCPLAIKNVCPDCPFLRDDISCASCGPSSQEPDCILCRQETSACMQCISDNESSIPESCREQNQK